MVAGRKKNVKNKINKQFYNNLNKVIHNNLNVKDSNNISNNSKQKLFDDELYNNKDKYILAEKTKKEMKKIWNIFNTPTPKKILNLSDLHAPYTNFEKLEIAINDNLDCDICVLNGDVFDNEAMSVFDKMDEIDSSEEFNQVKKILDVLSKKFKHVVWVGGNHDWGRFCKYIIKNIKPGLRKFAFDRLNPIKYLTEAYPNIIAINHNTLEIGDVVFKHPNGYSSIEMKTAINELDVMNANSQDLPNPNFRAFIIGHTHAGGTIFDNRSGKVIMVAESLSMCHIYDYRFNNPTKKRWVTGYARIELDKDNKIMFDKSKIVCLE
jgi:Icc-related predicted phosphoesterase